jgi:hypothetical protein
VIGAGGSGQTCPEDTVHNIPQNGTDGGDSQFLDSDSNVLATAGGGGGGPFQAEGLCGNPSIAPGGGGMLGTNSISRVGGSGETCAVSGTGTIPAKGGSAPTGSISTRPTSAGQGGDGSAGGPGQPGSSGYVLITW